MLQQYFASALVKYKREKTISALLVSKRKRVTFTEDGINSSEKGSKSLYSSNLNVVNHLIINDDVNYNVFASDRIDLEPYSRYILRAKVRSSSGTAPPNGLALTISSQADFSYSKYMLGNTCSFCNKSFILLECLNLSPSVQTIQPNTLLTTANPVLRQEYSSHDDEFFAQESSQNVCVVTSSENLADSQLRAAYRDILLLQINAENSLCILQKPEELDNILDFLIKNWKVIALEDDPVGICPLTEFNIRLQKDAPSSIYTPQYQLPHRYLRDIDEWVQDGLKKGSVELINSPHSSPLLVIPKKNGAKPRIVFDLRRMNMQLKLTVTLFLT